jgi:hypothetical protein
MNFTEQYFNEEIGRFRQMMSDRKFWEKDDSIRELAIRGLTLVYLNVELPSGDGYLAGLERVATIFKSTLSEYTRRGTLMILQPFRDHRPNCPQCQRPNGVARDSDGIFRCHMVDHPVPVICEEKTLELV